MRLRLINSDSRPHVFALSGTGSRLVAVTGRDLNRPGDVSRSLFKAELVRNKGPWCGLDDLEIATVEYIDWHNNRRLHGELGHIPPAEHEALHAITRPVTAPLKTS